MSWNGVVGFFLGITFSESDIWREVWGFAVWDGWTDGCVVSGAKGY